MDIFVTIYRVMVKYYFTDFFCKALTHPSPPLKTTFLTNTQLTKMCRKKLQKVIESSSEKLRYTYLHNSFDDVTHSNRRCIKIAHK